MNILAKELLKVAKTLVAGDEFVDGETYVFAKEVANELRRRGMNDVKVRRNIVDFVYSPTILVNIPLTLRLDEFGYDGKSESVNGSLSSPADRAFRIPGGWTKNRDPKEFVGRMMESLEDIMRRAGV